MTRIFLIFIFLSVCIVAYGQEKFPLTKEEIELLPYKGNETLIFKSSFGEYDTLKLKKFGKGYPNGPVALKYYAQIGSIHGDFSDPVLKGKRSRYLYGRLFEIIAATPEQETTLGIFLKAKNAVFYGPSYFTKSQIQKFKRMILNVSGKELKDVIIIPADLDTPFKSRDNFVTVIYWSMSAGIVKYVKINGEAWEKVN